MYNNPLALIRPELMALTQDAAAADDYFIGGIVLPPLFRDTIRGQWPRIAVAESQLLKSPTLLPRANKTQYAEVDRTYAKDLYDCLDWGLKEKVDDAVTRELTNYFPVEKVTTMAVRRMVQFQHEIRVQAQIQNTGNFAATASVVAYTAANIADNTVDFAQDLNAAMSRVRVLGERVNGCVMNREVWDRIRLSPKLSAYLFGSLQGGRMITEEIMAAAFKLKYFLVADSAYDSSPKNQNIAPTYIWNPTYVFVGDISGGEIDAGGVGRTVCWDEFNGGNLFYVKTYRDEPVKCDVFEVGQFTDEKILSTRRGTLITTQYS